MLLGRLISTLVLLKIPWLLLFLDIIVKPPIFHRDVDVSLKWFTIIFSSFRNKLSKEKSVDFNLRWTNEGEEMCLTAFQDFSFRI